MNSSAATESASSCEVDKNLDLLREIRFFAGLPMEMLRLLAYLCVRVNYRSGDLLFIQGEDDGQAIYIISGTARLIRTQDKQERVLREFGAQAFIGGLSLLGSVRRHFSLEATSEMVCLTLGRDKFSKVIQQSPDMMQKIIRTMVESINEFESTFIKTATEDEAVCHRFAGVSLL